MPPRDQGPCPARRGDPCAPKPPRPCTHESCYTPQGADAQSEWTEWSRCSASCGTGSRTRQCIGGNCLGPSVSTCNGPPCMAWSEWDAWSVCSMTCGVGEKKRTRVCRNGRDCEGPSIMVEQCVLPPCMEWSEWDAWEGCNVRCGQGFEKRTRQCRNGIFCPGSPFEQRPCDRGPCPHWSPWSAWTECSKTCNTGEKVRTRECLEGVTCEGGSEERLLCNEFRCPEWTDWTNWSKCDDKCGEDLVRLRNRVCLYQNFPSNLCEGSAQDQSPCPVRECAAWTEWGEWNDCSVTCGQGNQRRLRKCEGGNDCAGASSEIRFCQIASCPYWGPWADWNGCSVSCGLGVCERRRKCITDELLNLPSLEELDEVTAEFDNPKAALVHRSKQLTQEREEKGIDEELQPIKRSPRLDTEGGTCQGPAVESKECFAGPCCNWNSWSEWTQCIGCGSRSISKRMRNCGMDGASTPPRLQPEPWNDQYARRPSEPSPGAYSNFDNSPKTFFGLQPIVPIVNRGKRQASQFYGQYAQTACQCDGDSLETRTCPEAVPCSEPPRPCEWSEWNPWCGCVRCRPGHEVRRRFCDRPTDGGVLKPDANCHCSGSDSEERKCQVDQTCTRRFSSLPESSVEISRDQEEEDPVPIQSSVEITNIRRPSNLRDSIVSTTAFPFPVCRWSRWTDWTSCQLSGVRTRSRECIGADEEVSSCTCIGTPTVEEQCQSTSEASVRRSEAEFEVESSILKECDWSQWSQWSACTVSCGSGDRIRRRRCDCDSRCGAGPDVEHDVCQLEQCAAKRRAPPLFNVPSN